jgi:hypothetical protein
MNKPDWKDAPEWANWLAQDSDGRWVWYHDEPDRMRTCWTSETGSKWAYATTKEQAWEATQAQAWEATLESRP